MGFPQGERTQILPGSLPLGPREHYRQHCTPCRGCCRKRASCRCTGSARAPLSPLTTPLNIFHQRACPVLKRLSCPAAVTATKGLTPCTHIQLENQISTCVCVCGGKLLLVKDPLQAQPAPAAVHREGTLGELLPCPSQHVVFIPLFPSASPNTRGQRGSQQGTLPGSCAAGFQQFFPASRGLFRYTALLYGVPGRQPTPLPSLGGFPHWALQTTSVLGPGNRGLCRKEFAGQRVELSCATLFLLAVTLTWRQRPERFGNSQSPWLAPLNAFGL